MRPLLLTFLLFMTIATRLHAAQSIILETEGYACMGDDKSRKQTELLAFQDGKRKASESATTHIRAESQVKEGLLERDLVNAYANAQVRVIQELLREWYLETSQGECYRVRMKVEVIPDEKAMADMAKSSRESMENDPAAPLNVRIWTDRPSYVENERVRIYLRGNKPFYGRVVYRQADGALVQLLPNPYRQQNHFNGGTVYELPADEDRFTMESSAPFGNERITLYAGTAPLGDIAVVPADSVYQVVSRPADVPLTTRGIKLAPKGTTTSAPAAAEFAEATAELTTRGK
jgi:hypothetical protein